MYRVVKICRQTFDPLLYNFLHFTFFFKIVLDEIIRLKNTISSSLTNHHEIVHRVSRCDP